MLGDLDIPHGNVTGYDHHGIHEYLYQKAGNYGHF